MSKETGAPAPTYFTDQHAQSMLLRDYFAAKAMQALISGIEPGKEKQIALVPHAAYSLADLMMKAREA